MVNKTNSKNPALNDKTRVFFACDKSDQVVEEVLNDLPSACQKFLADFWDEELEDTKTNWEKILQDEPNLLSN